MREDYREWLKAQQYAEGTQNTQIARVSKVESSYGSLDEAFSAGTYDQIIEELRYSVEDERQNKPNPSRIVLGGNLRSNLQSYRDAVVRYKRFLEAGPSGDLEERAPQEPLPLVPYEPEVLRQKFALERDMQAALRRDITHLSQGLRIVDDGAERHVASGFIDILCTDADGVSTVVELKAGKTDARVVGQILGYMGDLIEEDELKNIRGIIVAHEFDRRTVSAAKAVPNLELYRYSITFNFEREG
jgi:endonuclease